MMNIIETHNLHRKLESLSELIEDENLNIVASFHAKWMARRTWLNRYNLLFDSNIAVGDTVDAIIRQWINQPETRKIMFGQYTKIGSGMYKSRKNITYWCTLYL